MRFNIPTGWTINCIGEIADIVGGGTPSTSDPSNFEGGTISWITPKDLSGYEFRRISHGERNITKKGLSSSSARLLPAGTVLLTTRAPIGYVAIAEKPLATNQGFRNLVLKNGYDSNFIYYLLKTQTETLKSNAGGTTYGELAGSVLKKIEILLPPLPEQQRITEVLGALDDKIELNIQMNKTLEEIAAAIFKSWFIDFEPFQNSKFIDSELSSIPEGWKIGRLGEICNLNMGQSPPSTTYNEEGIGLPFYQGIRDFGSRYPSPIIFCSEPKKVASAGDILLSIRAPVGEVNIASEDCCIGRGVAALSLKHHLNNYLYYQLKTIQREWSAFESGTTFTAINKQDILNFLIIVPSFDVIDKFNNSTCLIDKQIFWNSNEIYFLTRLRDTLLPKLLSGEI